MRRFAAFAFLACVAVTLASEKTLAPKKESVCCREVSVHKITVPITGFMLQQERPPCVKAVIFFTIEGAVCSHWRETWVKEKVLELRRLRAIEKLNATAAAT